MRCEDENIIELIDDYVKGTVTAEEREIIERHCFECDRCFDELQFRRQVAEVIQAHGEELFAEFLQEGPARKALNWLFPRVPVWRQRWVYALAGLIFLAVLVPRLYRSILPNPYDRLAQFEAPEYIPLSLREPGEDETVKILFEEGMVAYAGRDFSKAIEKLSELAKTQPEFVEAFFYLGISYLKEGKNRRAINALQKAAALLEGYPLGEQSHWYLGMAYLKLKDKGKALKELQTIVDLKGAYKVNAQKMIEKIKRIGDELPGE